jgi:hypothetical protein
MFASGVADFGVYAGRPLPAITALADIRSVAGRAVAHVLRHDPAGMLPADPVTEQILALAIEQQRIAVRVRQRVGTVAPVGAAGTAVGVIAACAVLPSPDVHRAAEALHPLIVTPRGPRAVVTCPSTVDDWGRTTSDVLHAVALAALGPRLRPTDQLRYRTASPNPRQPDTPTAELRAQKVPTLLWPLWAVRLSPADGAYARTVRAALSGALLLAGTRLELADAARLLGSVTSRHRISTTVQLLHATRHWPDIAAALTRLVDYLDTHHVPIDYQRRRQLDYRQLLPPARWQRICRQAGARPGPAIRGQVARRVLFEQLSGMPAHQAPCGSRTATHRYQANITQFPATLTPQLAIGLSQAALAFLHRHGITDEPVAWQPPWSLVDGLDLREPDPEQIDVPALHRLVYIGEISIPTVARRFGVTTAAVHALLLERPAPARPRSSPSDRHPLREVLPRDVFTGYYLEQRLSLAEIDRRVGLNRGSAGRLAREYAIPIRGGTDDTLRIHPALPRDWLFEQYVTCERSLADLAREKRLSKSTVRKWAKIYRIPIQQHRRIRMNIPAAAAAAPPMLRPAITGPNAWQRLHRFAEATRHPTLGQASTALGIQLPVLIGHLNRLEREFGQPLQERAGLRRTASPTTLGRKVTAAVRATRRANPPR